MEDLTSTYIAVCRMVATYILLDDTAPRTNKRNLWPIGIMNEEWWVRTRGYIHEKWSQSTDHEFDDELLDEFNEGCGENQSLDKFYPVPFAEVREMITPRLNELRSDICVIQRGIDTVSCYIRNPYSNGKKHAHTATMEEEFTVQEFLQSSQDHDRVPQPSQTRNIRR